MNDSFYSNTDYYNNIKNILQKQSLIIQNFYKENLINTNYAEVVNNLLSVYTPPDYFNIIRSDATRNLSDILTKIDFTIPEDIILNNISSTLERLSLTFNEFYSQNFKEVSKSYINALLSTEYNFEFPDNISIAEMESIINEEKLENKEFDLDEFNREIALINFSNDLPNVLNHFVTAFTLADYYIDNSIKEKLYQTMVDGIIMLVGNGMAAVAVVILLVVLNYYFKDCVIYRDFIEFCKEVKKFFKD